ncbi:MAG: hypothetical protein CL539_05330 [Alcanivorax sp.]|uniref:DUF3293 domain-containing protein n=1 Tax=Alcanivorax sp. TaxID=1872427 RepID=UPI000C92D4F7|nr:DUF3293 domain-containing protein [Alcanivorax sp.]MAC14088.1 hypothetical protein [Alcanivorax sp.]|tara:strand:- start:1892 stop:2314 length:423 start_codon:yes stop_codon:yes gene_type:complete
MTITPELIAAYKSTDFEVQTPEARIVLKADQTNPEFDKFLQGRGIATSVIITAWNPWSEPRSREENEENQCIMEGQLRNAGFILLPSAGVDPTGDWEPEQSCCALGMTEEEGILWGVRFQQNAVITHEKGKPSKLCLCHP